MWRNPFHRLYLRHDEPRDANQLARRHEMALRETYSESVFAAYELDRLPVMGLLWQTGHLTIKEAVSLPRRSTRYRLGFPDYEVQ